ncbi:Palmitoyl-protein thioesterase 1 [Dispira parvispora]|uniref:Serine/threonine-protein phosphatase T n=1 Tax=Dispira parvispora TaxID=1520584 RepID=A0A9W8ARH4_9FUNG|nr:Palmitoyl-protein thioesterase 1 [Dispira parvispora]
MTSFCANPPADEGIAPSRKVVTDEQRETAENLKNEANGYFKNAKYEDAIRLYTEAIEMNPFVPAYYCNRAIAYIRTEAHGYALMDADKALELDPNFAKAYYRRATANMAMLRFKDSFKDFRTVVKRVPKDAEARRKLAECEKIVRRMEFEKAIEFDEAGRSVVDQIDLTSMKVEDDYDGARLPTRSVTHDDGSTETVEYMDKSFLRDMIQRFKDQKMIHKRFAYQIILEAKRIFTECPSLVDVRIPQDATMTVCGDVHGQFYDFIHIFELNGYPTADHWYLFNGDFVDRGSFSLEIILTLFAYKWLNPTTIYLARGNHETNNMNKVYGFEGEVKAKFSNLMFKLFAETFNALPLAHVIQDKIFVVHGGLFSQDQVTLDDIRKINRFSQPPSEGLMCELLWSDPRPQPGRGPNKRGVGIEFGPDITEAFLKHNNLDVLVRSHEVKDEGYAVEHNGKCLTVFSAPNYCDRMDNKGAFLNVTPDAKYEWQQFSAVPHPTNVKAMQYASQFNSFGF